MKKLWWKTIGKGKYHLILLHGWGVSAEVWKEISLELSSFFIVHLVDLPGFGKNYHFGTLSLIKMIETILNNAPDKAIWLGWSLGGLVASQLAIMYPERVQMLITVASSPCFLAKKNWPGIQTEMFINFQYMIKKDLQRAIEHFMFLQTFGAKTARKDMLKLKTFLSSPICQYKEETLNNGLEIIKNLDLRQQLIHVSLPHIRIYGYFDILVPYQIITILDKSWPNSKSIIFRKSAHIPFISHPEEFCKIIITFS